MVAKTRERQKRKYNLEECSPISDLTDSDDFSEDLHEAEMTESEGDKNVEEVTSSLALRRHYDPLLYGPELLYKSKKLQFKKRSPVSNRQHLFGTTENIKFGARKIDRQGHIEYITFHPTPPKKVNVGLHDTVDAVLQAFKRASQDSLLQHIKMALLEDSAVHKILQVNNDLFDFFFKTLSDSVRSVLISVLEDREVCFSSQQLAENTKHLDKVGKWGGTYIAISLNPAGFATGMYVGRSSMIESRIKDHHVDLAVATQTALSLRHIESLFYQHAARGISERGTLIFFPAHAFPIVSQDSQTYSALFEAMLCLILGTFQMNKVYLDWRSSLGLPAVPFLGLNSTPCMERPNNYSNNVEADANPTLASLRTDLRNIYIRYGLLCSTSSPGSDEISKEDESALEHEYESKYTEYLSELAKLLKAGTYKLRIVREKYKSRNQDYYSWKMTNFSNRTLPRKQMEKILKAAEIDNESNHTLLLSAQLEVGEPDASSDLFIGTAQNYRKVYGGIKVYLIEVKRYLQFHTVFHRTGWQINLANRLLKCCPAEVIRERFNLLERLKRESTFFSKHDLDVQELIKGELPVSIQSRSVVAHLNSGQTILFPVSPHSKKCLERNDEEKEFVSSIQS